MDELELTEQEKYFFRDKNQDKIDKLCKKYLELQDKSQKVLIALEQRLLKLLFWDKIPLGAGANWQTNKYFIDYLYHITIKELK